MTRQVLTVAPDDTVLQAVRLMLQNRISGLPVVDAAGKLVGIVSEGDFLRRTETGTQRQRPNWLEFLMGPGKIASEYVQTHGRKVGEVMTADPVVIAEDTPLDQAVQLMEKRRIKRLPVVRDGKVIGILSRANLLHALASVARDVPTPAADDYAIRERLLAHLEKQAWAPLAMINVVVRRGVVEFWGTLIEENARKALIVAAENVPGVKAVRDHLALIEPASGTVIYQPDQDQAREPRAGEPERPSTIERLGSLT
jgi:CBS domain-containing protein